MVSLERAKRLLKSKETQKEYEMLKTPVAKFTPVEALKPEAVIAPAFHPPEVQNMTAMEALQAGSPRPQAGQAPQTAQAGYVPQTAQKAAFDRGINEFKEGVVDKARIFGENLMAGLGQWNKAFYGTLQSIGGDKIPGVNKVLEFGKEVAERDISKGGTDIGSQLIQAVPNAAISLGMAAMTGGASLAPQLGKSVTQQAIQTTLRNPVFYNSLLRSYGGAYNEAREAGQDRGTAITAGLLTGIPEAVIEQAGGIEQVFKRPAKGLLPAIGRAALEEAAEEIAQYPFGGAVKKALYAPETPVYSTTEEAVINPAEMGKGAFIGGVMGGLMGGVGKVMTGDVGVKPVQKTYIDYQTETPRSPAIYGEPIQQAQQRLFAGDTQQDIQQFTPIGGEPISQPLELPDLPVRYNPNLKNEASNKGDHIEVGDKFYQLSPEQQETILVHENAHNIADEYLFKQRHFEEIMNNKAFGETKTAPNGRTYWEGIFGDVGANSVVETFTEAIAVYKGNPQWLQERHPQAYEYIKNNVVEGLSAQQGFTPIGGEYAAASIETPALTVQIPTEQTQARIFGEPEIPKGQRERGFIRNIRTDEARPEPLRQTFSERTETYIQIFGKETVEKAQKVFNEGLEPAITKLYGLVEKIKPEAAPLSKMIADELTIQGQVDRAREIVSTVASRMTEAGQFTQAARLLRQADAATFLMTVNKQLAKLNEQGRKRYGKKWTDVDLTAEEKAAIEQIQPGDQEAYDSAMEQIRNRLANEMPSDAMEKFDAWRRIAMLLNPKTHIRNIGGNVIMMGMRKTADTMGAGLEVITDEIRKAAGKEPMERTKSVGWSFDKGRVDTVNKSWETVKSDMEGSSRWKTDIVSALGKEKRTFETGFLQWLNDVSFETLNLEDNVFTERAYKDALGQYLKANKMTGVNDRAVEYATRRALEATYRQHNKAADAINNLKRTRGAGKLLEAAIPFTKTPANIAKTAFEYSPLGLSKTFFQSDKSPAAIIETISKGMTGVGIFGLGMLLKSLGWAKGGKKRSEKSEALEQVSGIQQYSIITPQGSFTLDWAQPFAIPFFMGVSLMEKLEQQEDFDYDAFMDAAAAGGDTFFNMTMLQNVKQLLGGAGSTSEAILGLPWDYVQQAWPAVFGQAARTIDDTRRSTYDPDGWKQIGNTLQSKIPYIGVDWLPSSKKLEPALDVWGQEQSQGGVIQQFISPGYWREATSDPVTQEIARLFDAFRDTDMLPKVAPKSFSADKVKYTLSAEQRTQFQRDMGQDNYNDIARLISTAEYKRMTDAQKVKKIKKIVNDNYNDAKEDIIKASALKGN